MKTQLKPPSYYSTVCARFIIHAIAHDDWKIARITKLGLLNVLIASVSIQNSTYIQSGP